MVGFALALPTLQKNLNLMALVRRTHPTLATTGSLKKAVPTAKIVPHTTTLPIDIQPILKKIFYLWEMNYDLSCL
ncbi:hypothetical protein PN36_15315 [Candidatus Thiomargarita nelsonii]|uniref:Uncharacterized protein n=1 Tax=Candidatus Thiomargarita nelsonii TaxID=1003181 RepID=A0A4E0R3E3_9GAMM|nr:hypothetical protein PN36_15315 [Candidatus Thiomargarita nelsonii]